MSREALVLLVCCCDFRDGAERLIPSKSLRNAVIRAFPGLFRILRMCAPRRAAAVVRPRGREKSADRRRRILISRLLIIRASVPRRKSPFPAYFKGFPAVSPLIPPYPAFLKYPVSPQLHLLVVFTEQLFAALVSSGGNRRLSLAALNNRDFVVWAGHFVSLLSVIGGWGGVLPPHFGRKKAGDLFQISCSVCRCEGGGYLAVKVRDKLTRWVDGTLKNYGSLVISSLA